MGFFSEAKVDQIEISESSTKRHTLLIVDDEEANLRALTGLLEKDYHLITAQDGDEALDIVKNDANPERIHLIIADQRMPNMTGVDFLKQTIAIVPQTIRMILTGFTDIGVIIRSINEGQIYKFVTKPFDPSDMMLTVQRALERYELERRNIELIQELKTLNLSLEHKVTERTTQLKTAYQHKQEFLQNISHEIRTPTDAIHRLTRHLNEGTGCVPPAPEQKEFLDLLQGSSQRLMDLVNRLLTLMQGQERLERLQLKSLDLHPAIRSVSRNCLGLFSDEVVLSQKFHDAPIQVEADTEGLAIILTNLIANAAKYTHRGSVEIQTELLEKTARVSICDTGIGLDEVELNRIFERFARSQEVVSTLGTGLGLAITKTLVQEMAGEIGVTSQKGEGSTFWFTIPLSRSS